MRGFENDDGLVGRSSRAAVVDLDVPPTSTAAMLIEEGHAVLAGRGNEATGDGRGYGEPGGKRLEEEEEEMRAASEGTVTDELSSSSCTYAWVYL